MTIDHTLLFSYLEEDNVQRAYFRVRPLLSPDEDIREEAALTWPTDGCLRIVPDRNEQHTFKSRMRSLGSYCVIDLLALPADAGKIRTNKNFRPDKGEPNQFILYSDTVQTLPEHSFYEIVDGTAEEFAAAAERAITPRFYIRQEDTLYGPVRKAAPEKPETASEAAGVVQTFCFPDGVTRTILCMHDAPAVPELPRYSRLERPLPRTEPVVTAVEAAPAAEAPTQEETALPIAQNLNILDQSKNFEETLQSLDRPLSTNANLLKDRESRVRGPQLSQDSASLAGTPLIRTPLRTSTPQPKNRVQEVVSNQWMIGKYEPPAQNLPSDAAMQPVANPVEAASLSLRKAWRMTEAQPQLIDLILSLDGIRARLDPKLCQGANVTILQRVLRDRLQDLEAERLTALCELDKAKRNTEAYREELIAGMAARLNRETGKLEQEKQEATEQVEALKNQLNALAAQRDALNAQLDALQGSELPAALSAMLDQYGLCAPIGGPAMRLAPQSGAEVSLEEMLGRMERVCQRSGVPFQRNRAIVALVLLALCPDMEVGSPTVAPLNTLARNIAAAFGWDKSVGLQSSPDERPLVARRPVDSAPAVLLTPYATHTRQNGLTTVRLFQGTRCGRAHVAEYRINQYPVMAAPALPFVPLLEQNEETQVVSEASLKALLENNAATEEELNKILTPVLAAIKPLSGEAQRKLYKFVSVCAALLEGALSVALDWGILLWVVPSVGDNDAATARLRALLDEYPMSQAALGGA